jgi:glycine dehydrogenase subunit 2
MDQKLLIELSSDGKNGVRFPDCDVEEQKLEDLFPPDYIRKSPPELPQVSIPEVVRHFVNLSALNHHVDKAIYPLGSCTMKYNPKINEAVAAMTGFTEIHPLQSPQTVQGALKIYKEVENFLCAITGMAGFTLQPAAGSHGELTGVMIMRRYHQKKGNQKKVILIPDSAHGTNPASVAIGGYEALQVKSTGEGLVDIEDLKKKLSNEVAGFMLTNPNTVGLFEENVLEISRLIHEVDGLMYMDGANMNALLGIVKTGRAGFDITHLNLHKTFSTPHGGGGPGSGPIGVNEKLLPFLPTPVVREKDGTYFFDWDLPESIGKIHSFWGNYGVILRAWTYIRMLGAEGLKQVSRGAIINANYLKTRLEKTYELPYTKRPMHECVFSGDRQKAKGARTLDIAKRLLDYGVHAPTVYFPLIVHEALMIEPTETESKASLDYFADVMLKIDQEIDKDPEIVTHAPYTTPVSRLDEGKANRELNICWQDMNKGD